MPPPRQLAAANKIIFVDREILQRIFEKVAFAIPADRSTVCVFYGVGGQGKTALCRELFRKMDRAVEPSYGFLRRAELDLHDRSKTDPVLLLVWIRDSFVKSGVDLPAFDLALAIIWEATRPELPFPKLTKPWLGRTTEGVDEGVDEGANAAAEWLKSDEAIDLLGDVVGEIPGLGFLFKKGGKWAIDKAKKTYLFRTREALKELYSDGELKKPYELSKLLPRMLAQDLNFYIAAHPDERLVLLIDEYERVFDEGGAGTRWNEIPFDANIRRLITETNGLLAVFFSRERLPWEDDPDWRDDLKGAQHLLGGLADKDADDWLSAIPVEDAAIREAIIGGARETPQPDALVYPLMLELLVEHWRTLASHGVPIAPEQFKVTATSFEGRRREIVARVLRAYGLPLQTTLERLSVARRFDGPAFAHVVQTFGTALPLDQFDQIAVLSFVTKSEDGFLTIHNAIADTIRETLAAQKRRASIDAIFDHFDARAKVNSPLEVTDETIVTLIEASFLRQAQGIEGYAGWLSQRSRFVMDAARFASVTALWREAVSTIEDHLGPEHPDTGQSLNNLAGLLQDQGDFAGARPLYERALAIREEALGPEHPDTAQSLNNLAGLLQDQGDFAGARPLYERALAIAEKALGPEHPHTATSLNNLAGLLRAQGDFAGARPL
jgi:tetratricopeptide (TPR) repeat protein